MSREPILKRYVDPNDSHELPEALGYSRAIDCKVQQPHYPDMYMMSRCLSLYDRAFSCRMSHKMRADFLRGR